MDIFKDRQDAGQKLGKLLIEKNYTDPVILALPRGGVPVANEVAQILRAPLDVVIARKIGEPGHEEFGIGALSENEIPIFNPDVVDRFDFSDDEIMSVVNSEMNEVRRRILRYRQGRQLDTMTGKTIILVDDGLATGVSAVAAGKFLKTLKPHKIVLAVPVGPRAIESFVKEQFDEIVCYYRPINFRAVGDWYEKFEQVEDSEVMAILEAHHSDRSNTIQL